MTLSRTTFHTDVIWKKQNVTLSRTTFSTGVIWKNKMWYFQEPPSPLVSSGRTKCDIIKNHHPHWCHLEEQNVTLSRTTIPIGVIWKKQNVTLSRTTFSTGVIWKNKMWYFQEPPSPLVSSGRTECDIIKNHLLHWFHLEEQNVTLSRTTIPIGVIWKNKM